jgi:hypothetical protein
LFSSAKDEPMAKYQLSDPLHENALPELLATYEQVWSW